VKEGFTTMERIVNFKYDTMSFLELLNNPGKSIARWIEKAIAIAGKRDIRLMALEDDDLKPLWEQIGLEISFDRHSGVGFDKAMLPKAVVKTPGHGTVQSNSLKTFGRDYKPI